MACLYDLYMIIHSPVKVWRKQKEVNSLLGKKGKIVSFSLIHVPPLGFSNQAPYYIALIETEDGKRRMGQIVETEEIRTNMKVIGVLRRIREVDNEGIIPYGVKWKAV